MSDRGDHGRIEELLSIRALDGLDPDDRLLLERLMREHGEGCEACRTLQDDYAEVAGRLAFALAPAVLPEGFEDRVVALATEAPDRRAAVDSQPHRGGSESSAVPSLDERRDAPSRGTRGPARRAGIWRGLVAAAAALALFAGGWLVRDLVAPAEPDLADARVVAFSGERGELAVAYRPGEPGAYLVGSELPSPGRGRVLEVWMIHGDRVTRGACLTPADDGSIATFVDADLGSTATMAVTVEPASCPSRPSTDPILTADLGAGRTT